MRKTGNSKRRQGSLTRESIVDAAIKLLDEVGEGRLTFQVLSKRLSTGPGAIYWHVENKDDLIAAACDTVVAAAMSSSIVGETPQETIKRIALRVFDMIDVHPWVGSVLSRSAGQMPMVRLLEPIGQQVQALGVQQEKLWVTASALISYVFGVAGQNAANARLAKENDLDRTDYLDKVSTAWSQLDPLEYPFSTGVAQQFRIHDDREDFLGGIDLILGGVSQQR
ncbi:TetR/AcrR family transcriptional regulator [Neorhizobium lilium]|uniref:TetR/AcrR family transcriptional regulator n=2 Tax=Neorhizobium lilium TaxID=2503024 RepID=A0A3S3T0X6_9HYPH|nr:TetR/AcrR family transcriptional regulator [Neorhizobium lilium]